MAGRAVRFGARGDSAIRLLRAGAVRLRHDTAGASGIEYGLVTLLMVIGCFVLLLDTGKSSANTFAAIDTGMRPQGPPGKAAPQSMPLPDWYPDPPAPPQDSAPGNGGLPGGTPPAPLPPKRLPPTAPPPM